MPLPFPRHAQVDAADQRRESFASQLHATTLGGGPMQIRRRSSAASKPLSISIRRPSASTIRNCQFHASLAGRPRSSTISTGTILSPRPSCALRRRHASSVCTAKPCAAQNSLRRMPLRSNSKTQPIGLGSVPPPRQPDNSIRIHPSTSSQPETRRKNGLARMDTEVRPARLVFLGPFAHRQNLPIATLRHPDGHQHRDVLHLATPAPLQPEAIEEHIGNLAY